MNADASLGSAQDTPGDMKIVISKSCFRPARLRWFRIEHIAIAPH